MLIRSLLEKATQTSRASTRTLKTQAIQDISFLAPTELHRQEAALKTWGFVIYRCSYTSNKDWKRFMELFKQQANEAMAIHFRTPDPAKTLSCTIIEDPSLNKATTTQIRFAFTNWIISPEAELEILPHLKQQTVQPRNPDPEEERLMSRLWLAPRYHFCIQVDEIALNSMLKYGESKGHYRGHVNLVNACWEIPMPEEWELKEAADLEINLFDEGEEPIEGCRLYDVGWMRCYVRDMFISLYGMLMRDGVWEDWYL
jgi:hypothetical protein